MLATGDDDGLGRHGGIGCCLLRGIDCAEGGGDVDVGIGDVGGVLV